MPRRKIEWKVIKDFPNYKISSNGEIVNISRNRPVSQHISNGRRHVMLYKNNVQYMQVVARLLAEAFIAQPEGTNCVKHKDGNRLNDSLDNLYWATETTYWNKANTTRRKPVICVETGERFESVRTCTEATGFSTKKVLKSIREGCAVELKRPGSQYIVLKSLHFVRG